MNGYRSISTGCAGMLVALTAVGCAAGLGDPQQSEAPAAPLSTTAWLSERFDPFVAGQDLNAQRGWAPVVAGQHSPRIWHVGLDGNYDHKQGVKMVNMEEGVEHPGAFTSARRFVSRPTTARYQHLVFQVRVNDEVPAVNSNKGALVLQDEEEAALLKVYFTGTNLRLCGSDYTDSDCDSVFPGHDGFPCGVGTPFDHVWYRVVVFIDRKTDGVHVFDDGIPSAYAEIGLVGNECVITRTRSVKMDEDPITAVVLYEFSQVGGAVLIDNILGTASDDCCKL